MLRRQCDVLEKAKGYVISENYETNSKLMTPDAQCNLAVTN